MSSRAVTAAVLCAIAALALALSLLGRTRVPTLGALIGWLSRHWTGRVLLFAVWAWSGWHFFAR